MPSLQGLLCHLPSPPSAPRAASSRSSSAIPPSHLSAAPSTATPPVRQIHSSTDQVYSQAQLSANSRGQNEEDDGEESDRDEDEVGGTRILAISAVKGRLGCFYYDAETRKLHFVEDQAESSSFDLTNLILEQLLPSIVLTSATADTDFLTSLESTLSTLPISGPPPSATASSADAFSSTDQAVKLEYRPAREFYAGAGKMALSKLHINEGGFYADEDEDDEHLEREQDEDDDGGYECTELGETRDAYDFGRRRKRRRLTGGIDGDRSRRNRELRLESFLNGLSASPLSLGCAGALLGFVSRAKTSAGDLEADDFEVTGLELLKLDKIMHINSDALTSLQIFSDESHASTHSSATKEGLSLFGIVNLARTPLARVLMREWFLRPSVELDVIKARQKAVECFLRSENQHITDAILSHFRLIKNVPRLLKTLSSGRGTLKDWQSVWQVLYGAIMVRDALLSLVHARGVEVVEKFLESFDALTFKEVGSMITDVIDWEESGLQKNRVCVRPGVEPDLDEWRRQLNGLPSFLSKIATQISASLPPEFASGVKELSLVYFPQLGFLITIPYEPEADVMDAGRYGEMGWDFQFVTEARAYYKSGQCYELDKHVGDLHSFIAVHALLTRLVRLSPQLLACSSALSELDCLIAFAETSRLYEWNKPEIVKEPVVEIVNGRHPLAELCVEAFVKNSTRLSCGHGAPSSRNRDEDIKPFVDVEEKQQEEDTAENSMSILILTGANFSGKSVYLKQVALIVFLAHVGCFVPADAAKVGLTDRMLTRVSTRESVTRGASAFMIDLQQMSFILRNATPSSLVLIDEFGKGTEADDGPGLFCGVVEWLVGWGRGAPRTVVTTHFQHVFLNGLLSRQLPGVELAHMQVLVHKESSALLSTSASTSTCGKGKGKSGEEEEKMVEKEQLTYLYRLSPGLSLTSHAASCALLFGLPLSIVARASHITRLVSTFSLDELDLEEKRGEEAERERKEVEEGERVARGLLRWEFGEDEEGEMGEGEGEEVRERLRRLLDGEEEDEA
ncbi:hypothetical protein JCM8547_005384 [Rhodosporidiobolus lusitaniae]